MTGTAITIPIILFLIFEAEYLSDELTIFIPILIVILYVIILLYLILATFCDPGIIRKFFINNNININEKKDENNERIFSKIFHLGKIISYKYCYTCGIMRPNKSTHCKVCNNCVESPVILTTAILCNKATIRICRTAIHDQYRKKGFVFGQTQKKQYHNCFSVLFYADVQ